MVKMANLSTMPLLRNAAAARYLVLAALLVCAACPRPSRKTLVAAEPAQTGNQQARQRFLEARSMFLADGSGAQAFEQLRKDFPDDPIAAWVDYYRGLALLRGGEFVQAEAVLSEVARSTTATEPLQQQIAMYRLIARVRNGELAQGQGLREFQDALRPTSVTGTADAQKEYAELRQQYWAALATSNAASPHPVAALPAWDQYFQTATNAERAWCVQQLDAVVAAMAANKRIEVWQSSAARKSFPSAIVLARYVAAAQRSSGQLAAAAETLAEVASAAKELDVSLDANVAISSGSASSTGPGTMEQRTIVALIPVAAKQQRIADAVIAAAALAAGTGTSDRGAAVVHFVRLSDAANAPTEMQEAIAISAIALIGPVEAASVDAAAAQALTASMPMISLATRADSRASGPFVLHIIHSAESRARQLARRSVAKGIKDFAVAAPQNGYGKAVAAAFVAEVTQLGARVVLQQEYAADTKSFASVVSKWKGSWQALFVPDQADKLELLAPALAAAGLLSRPAGSTKATGGRPILLLTTAEGMTPSFAASAGRYCEGALISPGYVAGTNDPHAMAFEQAFAKLHGRAPTSLEAYAYDAIYLIVSLADRKMGRVETAAALRQANWRGVTGTVTFASNGRRSDAAWVYSFGATSALTNPKPNEPANAGERGNPSLSIVP